MTSLFSIKQYRYVYTAAMQKFANLSEEEKQKIIAGTHSVSSKEEMQSYVNKLLF